MDRPLDLPGPPEETRHVANGLWRVWRCAGPDWHYTKDLPAVWAAMVLARLLE